MTAIYGLWRFFGGDVAADFERLDRALARYGSDDHSTFSPGPGLAVGRHLHKSLPEDLRPSQPSNRRYAVVGDVRLTERDELARQLGLGPQAAGMSDSAIAAAAVEAWHEQAFDRIYGVFAIAAWDSQKKRLLLARDHLGQKPLFFHASSDFFAFASMPDGLHALPDVRRGADMESVKRLLAGHGEPFGHSHLAGIGRVMPGHYAVVTADGLSQTRYWKPDLRPLRLPSHEDYAVALSERLDRAVEAALRGGEGKVGSHLSSGFDSTAVTSTAAVQLAARGERIVAYTAAPREGFEKIAPNCIADESDLAAITVAMHKNIDHVIVRPRQTPMASIERSSSIYGMPVPNLCNEAWFNAINDDARDRGIRIMLEGATGNATISETGVLALPELVRAGRFVLWSKLALAMLRGRSTTPRAILWQSFSQFLPGPLYGWIVGRRYGALALLSRFSALKDGDRQTAARDAANESSVPGAARRLLKDGSSRATSRSVDERLTILAFDYTGASHKGMLGHWKIDYRDPTADRRLVEFSLRVPAEQLIRGGKSRAILRKVLADRAPAEVLDNSRKGIQAADWHEWFSRSREQFANEIARIEMYEPTAELIDVERLKALIERWPAEDSDAWADWEAFADYRWSMLRAVSAANFMRQVARSNH